MANRSTRRARHRLIPWPKGRPMPVRGLTLSAGQRVWTCSCGNGWMTMTSADPAEAFAGHVADSRGERVT